MCAVEGLNEKYEAGNEKSESTSDVKIQFLLYHVRFKQRGKKVETELVNVVKHNRESD